MNNELAVRARAVTKTYSDVQALRGVDLDIHRGECVALLGPNGAGKTTMTEILEGFRIRNSGEVSVLGVDPAHGDLAWKARLGIVLQTAADLKELRVTEAVRHFAEIYPRSADVDEVIEVVGLAEKRDAMVRQLSGGQRRRLDVALGIIGQPELLFLDEPTTGFDPEARRHFWTLIEGLKAKGVTILLTTHYLDEADRLADRVAVIAQGCVLADQSPSSLRAEAMRSATVHWVEDGVQRLQQTEHPTAFVRELVGRFDGEIPELSVVRPSLEDVYLHLVFEAANAEEASA
jgi:ABC-2 type transport system ATP-binding protein